MKTFRYIIILCFLALAAGSFAQDTTRSVREWYNRSGSELIFSFGNVWSHGQKLDNDPRFSAFFHINNQSHFDFNNAFGMYMGFSVTNVGFVNHLAVEGLNDIRLKQRSYSAGIPLAVKFGDVQNQAYLALGACAEYMFHYKRKVFYEGEKSRRSEWFSDKVKPFNPSLFGEIHFVKGAYIRFKYYLHDFLTDTQTTIILPETLTEISFKPEKSTLFYISAGTVFKVKKKKNKPTVAKTTEL